MTTNKRYILGTASGSAIVANSDTSFRNPTEFCNNYTLDDIMEKLEILESVLMQNPEFKEMYESEHLIRLLKGK